MKLEKCESHRSCSDLTIAILRRTLLGLCDKCGKLQTADKEVQTEEQAFHSSTQTPSSSLKVDILYTSIYQLAIRIILLVCNLEV